MSDDQFIDEISLQEAQNIIRAGMSMLRHEDPLTSLKAIFHGCREELGAKAGHVVLLHDDRSENDILYQYPEEYLPNVDQEQLLPTPDLWEAVHLSGRVQYHNNLSRSDSTKDVSPGHVMPNNMMSAPLMVAGTLRGLLVLSNKDGSFTERDAHIAEHYGKLLALAMFNPWDKDFLESGGEKYRELLEATFDAIVFLDNHNDIVFANKAFREMFSYLEEGLKKNIVEILGPCGSLYADGVHDHSTLSAEGGVRHLEISFSKTDMGKKSEKTLIIRDVTEKKAHEKAMRLIGRKMELMGRITRHDVMNDIMVVQGFMDLSYDAGAPISDKYHSRINAAIEKIQKLYSLQREFEELGSSELRWIDVGDALSRAQESLGEEAHPIKLQVDAGVSLWADHLLDKVFYNLLHNFLMHGERASRVILKTEFQDGGLFLDFADDGPGVPMEEKDSIFSLGFGKLSGHGLFLAKEILATYGMDVEEIGEPGEGAVFRISVPHGHWKES